MKIGIVGYGNLGKGVELALAHNPDMHLEAVFTRRPSGSIKAASGAPVLSVAEAPACKGRIDVLILCGGSATDLPEQGPAFAADFCTVDSFDTHAKIPQYFAAMDEVARRAGTLSLISGGWDPGLFSLARTLFGSILPDGADYTFWGKGVSQGHSDAIRRIPGVLDARQYTIPVPEALSQARSDARPVLTTRQKHVRDCYVVAAADADREAIRTAITTMPDYFADYDTTVTFISKEELDRDHAGLPHGGFVIRSGMTAPGINQVAELSLKLDSNPQFTAGVLVACARAVHRLHAAGMRGAISMLDVPFAALSPKSGEALRKELL